MCHDLCHRFMRLACDEVTVGKTQTLSPAIINALASGKCADPMTPGLLVSVAASGKKNWVFRRRIARSTTIIQLTLGTFPAFTIAAARDWARGLNETVERGEDPRELIRAEKARQALTIAHAHEKYMAAVRRGDRKTLKPRTITDKELMFKRDIGPRIGAKSLLLLTEDECWDAVYDKAKTSKVRANKMAGELSCFLKWCAGREGRMEGIDLKEHPAPTLNSNWFSTGPKANTRFLDKEEIGLLFRALAHEEYVYRRGLILL